MPSQLEETVEKELKWRESELSLAKIQLQRSIPDPVHFGFAYRCFVSMTYAHFEAYTKRVVAQAVQDIFDSGCKWSDCNTLVKANLFSSGLRKLLNDSSNIVLAQQSSDHHPLINKVSAPPLTMIMDCGNMNVSNFFWVLECVGLDISLFYFARGDVGHLAQLRNDCAHGKVLTFDKTKTNGELAAEMYLMQSRVLVVMHTLAVEILDHFAFSKFLVG